MSRLGSISYIVLRITYNEERITDNGFIPPRYTLFEIRNTIALEPRL